MKYKVGDKVKIRKDLKVGTHYGGCLFVSEMNDLVGKIARITNVFKMNGPERYHIHSSTKNWTNEMFEDKDMEVQGMNKRVVIDTHENYVIARCGDKEGIARCHPDDDFDFYTGAKIALERLEEAEKPYGWLKEGVEYYTPAFGAYDEDDDLWLMSIYRGESIDKMNMKRGIAFKTREEAIACAKKMLKAIKQEG